MFGDGETTVKNRLDTNEKVQQAAAEYISFLKGQFQDFVQVVSQYLSSSAYALILSLRIMISILAISII